MKNKQILFVSGIDTDVGKTLATGFYANRLTAQGLTVITQKLVQTGCQGIAEDIQTHRKIQKIPLQQWDHNGTTCRYVFGYPCSPHLAAAWEGRQLDLEQLTADTQTLSSHYDVVLIEGAGGLAVPLNREITTLDYLARQRYPLILVTSGKLGSINHTLLSLEVCQRRDIPLQAVIYNQYPQIDPIIETETQRYLQGYLARHFPSAEFIMMPICE
ncbi:dethiobiotin synthase [Chelonobacter oris]|uniref:dethiobiotin synthase n=1 Tax=Chelonobacter oris TaxID=505317 RepID=UPI00244A34D9|nr:dethiobiotin synthase [Chelonobacter oris]MDH3001443.1 dethiobiotin synthase [Chelonobacter oris]